MGAQQNKVFLPLAGKPVLAHTLAAFEQAPEVAETLLVAHADEIAYCEREIVARYAMRKVSAVIVGGASRHQSEECALAALRPRIETGEIALVMIHDGARPLLAPAAITTLVAATQTAAGAILVTPVADDNVVLRARDDATLELVAVPAELARAQTPQAFDARILLAAYDRAHADQFEGADTAAAVERLGYTLRAVPGSPTNLKITTPDDLLRAEALLSEGAI